MVSMKFDVRSRTGFARTTLITILLLIISHWSVAQINFPLGSEFHYLEGKLASGISASWMNLDFNDTLWKTGPMPFRYTDGTSGTNLTDMRNSYSTVYMRSVFSALDVERLKEFNFVVNYDDGFIIWVNGQEVLRKNAPENHVNTSLATADHESGTPESFTIPVDSLLLIEGENCLAVLAFNVTLNSSDFYIDLSVNAQPQLPAFPDSSLVSFSKEAGIYTDSINLTLNSPDPDYTILYTLDGSNPQKSSTAKEVTSPYSLIINPDNNTNRPLTPAVIVRASLVKTGYAPSIPVTHSYIFTEKVKEQAYPGGGWPQSVVNGQIIDLNIDQRVVTNSSYKNLINDALLQIPSISVTTDLENLFSSTTGIYVNATNHSEEWERPCSVELINPDGSSGFQINAGLRIRGGNSRNPDNPKHAFRLFFRKEYGSSKLIYPLFGTSGAEEFDKIDLRTEQNYSWSMDGSEHNTFVRDIFSRDSQRDLNQPYSRGDYFHLYLNGMYWGLFQTDERPEASYAESYLGDKSEDYDVIKVNVGDWPYFNEVNSGNMDAWTELWNLCKKGFKSDSDYFALIGKDPKGKPVKNSRVMVDIDNLIDYMLVIFYTGNVDAPVSAWHSNDMPNNYFAIYNRKDKGKGFVFIAHDSEHSMFVDPIFVSDGLDENRVTIDDPPMKASGILNFQPQWLHEKLTENAEYRIRFADRAYKFLNMNGALTPAACSTRFKFRADQINLAIIAESARWGDAQTTTPLTRDNDWTPEINSVLNDYIPYRTEILIDQLSSADLYSTIQPPEVKQAGTPVLSDPVYFDSQISLSLQTTVSEANIYYTVDGSDPRKAGGEVSLSAKNAGSLKEFEISGSSVIFARTYKNGIWSALKKVTVLKNTEDYSDLKITELQYHPDQIIEETDTMDSQDLEFIELKNTGLNAINISGIRIDSAISIQVPAGIVLAPGEFFVAASKPEFFYKRYGMNPSGNYSGQLSNSGEYILVTDPGGHEIFSLTYSDNSPWPSEADGIGYSLVPKQLNPVGNPNEAEYWRKSLNIGGSPFADDVNIVGVDNHHAEEITEKMHVFPNPTSDFVNISLGRDEIQQKAVLTLYDLNGSILLNKMVWIPAKISLSDLSLSPGIYMIKLTTDEKSLIEKFIYITTSVEN
jgi:hypothetical protein